MQHIRNCRCGKFIHHRERRRGRAGPGQKGIPGGPKKPSAVLSSRRVLAGSFKRQHGLQLRPSRCRRADLKECAGTIDRLQHCGGPPGRGAAGACDRGLPTTRKLPKWPGTLGPRRLPTSGGTGRRPHHRLPFFQQCPAVAGRARKLSSGDRAALACQPEAADAAGAGAGFVDQRAVALAAREPGVGNVSASVVSPGQNPYKNCAASDAQSGRMIPLLSVCGISEPYNTPRQLLPAVYLQTFADPVVQCHPPGRHPDGSMTGKAIPSR